MRRSLAGSYLFRLLLYVRSDLGENNSSPAVQNEDVKMLDPPLIQKIVVTARALNGG